MTFTYNELTPNPEKKHNTHKKNNFTGHGVSLNHFIRPLTKLLNQFLKKKKNMLALNIFFFFFFLHTTSITVFEGNDYIAT